MAIWAKIEKESEDESTVRYRFYSSAPDDPGREIVLDKAAERVTIMHGVQNHIALACARKIATSYVRTGTAPNGMIVAS
ncbi:hypothetical protein EV193_106332 [Herbihabitans rhizosphaerae]|uniref:Uncharacterized protein n=1 Tax=Herbihabitans rhizosphaerae TaxID=1872711 RepID=A0A4Q7KLG1_9PSEU|nr:hypothetical protein [Herbihabitans rhizosphaerae]RZS37096.1 hypothetical protein EV193_106332 [Herbihabitans rhizosphaerae]